MQGQAFILAGVIHLQKTQCTGVPAAGNVTNAPWNYSQSEIVHPDFLE